MIWFSKLFQMRLRLLSKQAVLWVLLSLSTLLALLPLFQYFNRAEKLIPVAVVSFDEGRFSEPYIENLKELPNLSIDRLDDLAKAKRGLNAGRYEAVLQLKENFSSSIELAQPEEVFIVYLTPSSSIAGALGEIFGEQYLELWLEEFLIEDHIRLLAETGQEISPAEIDALRAKMESSAKETVLLAVVINEKELLLGHDPEVNPGDVLNSVVSWFCALVPFFIILSSRWVIDQRKNSLGARMKAMGISQVVSILASSLAMLLFCLAFLLIPVLVTSIALKIALGKVLMVLFAALLYLLAMIGVALLLASISGESVNLMLLAPLVVLLNTFLGGLVMPLPDWAIIWQRLSLIFPGRMLSGGLATGHFGLLLLGALLYFVLGVGLVWLVQERRAARED